MFDKRNLLQLQFRLSSVYVGGKKNLCCNIISFAPSPHHCKFSSSLLFSLQVLLFLQEKKEEEHTEAQMMVHLQPETLWHS